MGEPFEKETVDATKQGLGVMSPLLSEFFMGVHVGVKQVQELMAYDEEPTAKQMEAIEYERTRPPAIGIVDAQPKAEEKAEDEKVDDKPKQVVDKARHEWKVGSLCEVYIESDEKWVDGKIIEIEIVQVQVETENDKDMGVGEWLTVQYGDDSKQHFRRQSAAIRSHPKVQDAQDLVVARSQALTSAAMVRLNVIENMMEKFDESKAARALTMARSVEDCCMQIVTSQSTIRQSVLLASEILKRRPAAQALDKDATYLWDAVDKGVVRILKSAVQMTRATAQYFSFFLRFKQSFQYFEDNREKSLLVSLKFLQEDCQEFAAFREEFGKTVKALTDAAMDSIENCVKNSIGAGRFEKARLERERTENVYLKKKKVSDAKRVALQKELKEKQQKKNNVSANVVRLKYTVSELEQAIERNKKLQKQYEDTKLELDQMSAIQ